MSIATTVSLLLADHTFRVVAGGVALFGFVAGALGSFAMLRKQSLLGDVISHAALPGIVLAFLLTLSKHPLVLLIGAAFTGWIGAIFITLITRYTHLKKDAAMGIILSVFFGIGIFLLTLIQKLPFASQAGLDKFLFGSASTLLVRDVHLMILLSIGVLALLFLFWKEFKIITFDSDYARSIGLPVRWLDIFLVTLIVLAIVIGLQAVGVVLMSALLIAPAAAARQWTNRLGVMVVLSASFGAFAGLVGAIASSTITHLSTGPAIVVMVSMLFFISLFFAPMRGLLRDFLRAYHNRRQVQLTSALLTLYQLAKNHSSIHHPHTRASVEAVSRYDVPQSMRLLMRYGWVREVAKEKWALTTRGAQEAARRFYSLTGESA